MLECSFCGKNNEEVKNLVVGPQVAICSECVILCVELLMEKNICVIDPNIKKEKLK